MYVYEVVCIRTHISISLVVFKPSRQEADQCKVLRRNYSFGSLILVHVVSRTHLEDVIQTLHPHLCKFFFAQSTKLRAACRNLLHPSHESEPTHATIVGWFRKRESLKLVLVGRIVSLILIQMDGNTHLEGFLQTPPPHHRKLFFTFLLGGSGSVEPQPTHACIDEWFTNRVR